MNCTRLPGGGFVCGGAARRRRCSTPGCDQWAGFECDYQLRGKKSGTCDAPICERCRAIVGGLDYCKPHAKLAEGAGEDIAAALADQAAVFPEARTFRKQRDRCRACHGLRNSANLCDSCAGFYVAYLLAFSEANNIDPARFPAVVAARKKGITAP